jgi:hypothetical protein
MQAPREWPAWADWLLIAFAAGSFAFLGYVVMLTWKG